MNRLIRAIGAVAGAAALAACTHAPPPAPVAAESAPHAGAYGVIVSRRPIAGPFTTGPVLLAAMGSSGEAQARPLVEFIVRGDQGRTVSVVQADTPGLLPGVPVLLIEGAHPRIVNAR